MSIFYIELYEYRELRSDRRFFARGHGVTQPWACIIISHTPTHTVETAQCNKNVVCKVTPLVRSAVCLYSLLYSNKISNNIGSRF